MFVTECRRLLAMRRVWLAALATSLVGVGGIVSYLRWTEAVDRSFYGSVHFAHAEVGVWVPLLAAIATGDAVASDRRQGLIWLLVARSRAKWRYIVSKLAAMMAVAVAAIAAGISLASVVAYAALADAPLLPPTMAAAGPGSWAQLLTLGLIVMLAAAAVAGLCGLLSNWTSHPYVVTGCPFFAFWVATVVMPGRDYPLSPLLNMTVPPDGPWWGPLAYWGVLAAASSTGAAYLFARRDLLD